MSSTKMGRPPSENPKSGNIRVRIDADTLEKLKACSKALDANNSEIVRKGIDMVYNDLKK